MKNHNGFLDETIGTKEIAAMSFPVKNFVFVLAVIILGTGVQAATVVSNLPNSTAATPAHVGSFVAQTVPLTLLESNVQATSFTTGSSNMILDAVTLSMADGGSGTGFPVWITNDNAGEPATPLSAPTAQWFLLSGEQSPTTAGLFSYVPTSPLTLLANTRYWLAAGTILYTNDNPNFFVDTTADLMESGTDGWTIGDQRLKNYGPITNSWTTQSSEVFKFAISASSVPEPSRMLLLLTATGAGLMRRQRKPQS